MENDTPILSGATHMLAPLSIGDIGGHGTITFLIMPGVQKSKVMCLDSAVDSARGLPSKSIPKSYKS